MLCILQKQFFFTSVIVSTREYIKYHLQFQVNHVLEVYNEENEIQQSKYKYIIDEEHPDSLIQSKVSCFLEFVALIHGLRPYPRVGQ